MSGILFPKATTPKPVTSTSDAIQAQNPIAPAARSDLETASLANQQLLRSRRTKGKASAILAAPGASGGTSASRMLGSVART